MILTQTAQDVIKSALKQDPEFGARDFRYREGWFGAHGYSPSECAVLACAAAQRDSDHLVGRV